MAASVAFAIVDVFSTTPYKGNPLAVVDTLEKTLTDTQMRLITRQFNLSETTFFAPPRDARAAFRLRSFLPDGKEVLGAGHNILGAWWYLAHSGKVDLSAAAAGVDRVVDGQTGDETCTVFQELGQDVIPVRISRSGGRKITVAIRQVRPQIHAVHPDPAALAAAINLDPSEIGFPNHPGLPPQVMSTATTHHLLVPVASVEALNRVAVQRDRLLEQLAAVDKRAYGLYLFTQVSGEVDTYQARFFSPGMSTEDPATGSAAGPLSAYLHHHGLLRLSEDGVGEIRVLQGLRVGRECVIRVRLSSATDDATAEKSLDVDIIGSGVQVAEGLLTVPDRAVSF